MKEMLRSLKKTATEKENLAEELMKWHHRKRKADKKLKDLKAKAKDLFDPEEQVLDVTKSRVNTRVITPEMIDELKELDLWDDVRADDRVDMKKLDKVMKLHPDLQQFIEYDERFDIKVSS